MRFGVEQFFSFRINTETYKGNTANDCLAVTDFPGYINNSRVAVFLFWR
ncbi:MAG TPA: hypothetical protein VEY10_05905 [Flavisolibacter sp.]|nr:hypothetical protein [Flavisolibacter sp.]